MAAPLPPPAPPGPGAFRWAPGEARRRALFPIRHEDLWALTKRLQAAAWVPEEVRLEADAADWARLGAGAREAVKMTLAFFATIDFAVLGNLGDFSAEVDCLEARCFFAAQKASEAIHAESYGLQILAAVPGDAEQARLFDAVETFPVVARMNAWVSSWFASPPGGPAAPLGERLVAFAAVEGVLFSASFCVLQWLREQNVLPGVTEFNTFIARDEGLHTEFTALLVRRYLASPPLSARAHEIFAGVVAVLDEFVAESIPVALLGMNADLMRQYVRFQADFVLGLMGYPPAWGAENPFPFMEKFCLNATVKTNFFERQPAAYQAPTKGAFAFDESEPP